MVIKPSVKYFYLNFFIQFVFSFIVAVLPLMLYVIILSLAQKFGEDIRAYSTLPFITKAYLISYFLVLIFLLIKDYFYYKNTSLETNTNGVSLTKSFISHSTNQFPFISVKSAEVNQGLVERIFSLSTLYVYTKDTDQNLEISGLDYIESTKLANSITDNIKIKVIQSRNN